MEATQQHEAQGTRTMQYAISKAQKSHDQREERILWTVTFITLNPTMRHGEALDTIAKQFGSSLGAANGYYYVAKARLGGATPAPMKHRAPKKSIRVDGVRYHTTASAARLLKVGSGTLQYWNSVGKGIKTTSVMKGDVEHLLHAEPDVIAWKDVNYDLLAKVKKVGDTRQSKPRKSRKVRKMSEAVRAARTVINKEQGYCYGGKELAAYLSLTAAQVRHGIVDFGHPPHSLYRRAGKSMYVYSKAHADGWAKKHGLYAAPGTKANEQPFGGMFGRGVDAKTRKLEENVGAATKALNTANKELSDWNSQLKSLLRG